MEIKYVFKGTNEDYLDLFDTQEEAIAAAVAAYKERDTDALGFDAVGNVPKIATIYCRQKFSADSVIDDAIDTLTQGLVDSYNEFESSVDDDGDYVFREGFEEEMRRAMQIVLDDKSFVTGCECALFPICEYDLEKEAWICYKK